MRPADTRVISTRVIGIDTCRVDFDVPLLGEVPAGARADFANFKLGMWRSAPFVSVSVSGLQILVTNIAFPGAITRTRFINTPPPVWPNRSGGILLDYDVPVPFP